ncbi:hypothetical protein GCM10007979_23330 [Nocardioides albus]|nr:hypothetical protein GCM10007979_23330 [Nocardioides albus]
MSVDGAGDPGRDEVESGEEGLHEPIVLESAHRHGVAEEDMLHVLRFAIRQVRQDDDMVMFIGPDRAGVLCEVGAVIWWGGEFAVVHAMRPARSKYLR